MGDHDMQLAQRTRSCSTCGRPAPAAAVWCGACGDAIERRDDAMTAPAAQDTPDAAPATDGSRRSVAVVALVGVLLVAALVAEVPTSLDPDLLGRLDEQTGRSSRVAPADGLRLLWRRPVDGAAASADGPPRVLDLGGHVVVDDDVIDLSGQVPPLHLPRGAVPDGRGRLVLADGDEAVLVDVRTGLVRSRQPLEGPWRPVGTTLGWVAGAAVLSDASGVIGALELDGTVRWVGEPGWTYTNVGDGTDWAVVTAADGSLDRMLVVDGTDGTVHRDVGPVGVVHSPVIHGDTFAWVDPFAGLARGRGYPVEVHGVRLDGTGRVWAVTDLPSRSPVPEAVRLAAAGPAGLVVHHWTTGRATSAVWLDPVDGSRLGRVAVSGTDVTHEGWPVAIAEGDVIAHVDPVQQEVRVVDSGGRVRWSTPAAPGEGVVTSGDLVLVRTPPRGVSVQSRLRLYDAHSGELQWDRVSDSTVDQRIVAVLGDNVGVTAGPVAAPITTQSWFNVETGRRASGAALAASLVGDARVDPSGLVLLGRVADGRAVVPLVQLPGGRVVGTGETVATGDLLTRIGAPAGGAGGLPPTVVRADDDIGIEVGAASVAAVDASTGERRWQRALPVPLRPDLTLLLDDVAVVVGWDGRPRALDRGDGRLLWTGPAGVTSITAGGQTIVVGTQEGEVVVLDASGAQRQRLRVGQDPVEDVAVVAGRVVATVGSDVVGLGRGAALIEPEDRVEVS